MTDARVPLVIGNWKMNGLSAALSELAAMAVHLTEGGVGRAQCAICPPATLVERAVRVAEGRLAIGGQDCAATASGAHTGDVSAAMLADAGASLVIVGHSERRADHGESDAIIRAKAEAAHRAGLQVVLCVGESEAERDRGAALDVVGAQLDASVPDNPNGLVIAYEPVWAIGTGRTPTPEDVAAMHGFIRHRMTQRFGEAGTALRILYGGSVKPSNAAELMGVANVDGALIGGASLKAADFLGIAAVYR